MKIRSDSPFANADEKLKVFVREYTEAFGYEWMRDQLEKEGLECSVPALKRFYRRLKQEQLAEEAEENAETMARFAERAKDSKSMDGTIEATRQRLFEEAVETNDRETLVMMFKAMNEEKAQARMIAVEERKAKVAEENAKIGWRKLELQAAQSAMRLLPEIRETLMDATVSAEERVARALKCLMQQGGTLMLGNGNGG